MNAEPIRTAHIITANLHATSNPAIVVPWLMARRLYQTHRRHGGGQIIEAMLLQECTARHAKWFDRLPGWVLIRHGGDEAILIRRNRAGSRRTVIRDLERRWGGYNTGELHKPRTIPGVLMGGWLYLICVHFPPGWPDGPPDRRDAGTEYRMRLSQFIRSTRDVTATMAAGDWNTDPDRLASWRRVRDLKVSGHGIDHAAVRGCHIIDRVNLGRTRGMDHDAWLYSVTHIAGMADYEK